MQDEKVFQEFYCSSAGGGCGGYIRVRLNMNWDHTVNIECPSCKHHHQRCIKNGRIVEEGRYDNKPVEDICPPMSAWSKEPVTKMMLKNLGSRDGAVIKSDRDLARDSIFRERWIELYGSES